MPNLADPCQSRIGPFLIEDQDLNSHTHPMSNPKRVEITDFAPAERVSIDIVHRQAAALVPPPLPDALLESPGSYVLILNAQRQIVFASPNLRQLVPRKKKNLVLGSRLGELLDCIHAAETPGGCGTTRFCRKCGALQAILSSLAGKPDAREYRLTRMIGREKGAQHLFVMSEPLVGDGEMFSIVALTDGADAKARRTLKQLFVTDNPKAPTALPRAKIPGPHYPRRRTA